MRIFLFFSSIFFLSTELISANIDIFLFKKAAVNKIYSSSIVFLNPGDKFRFLIRSDKNDKINVTTYKNSLETDKTNLNISANEEIYIPGEKGWYTFNEDFESIKLRVNNKILPKEMVLYKLVNQTYDSSLLEGNTENIRNNGSFIHNLEERPKKISSIKINKKETTRSVAGQLLYKEIADLVVLISSGNSRGSGVVISNDGQILTNWHVVEDYTSVGVIFKPPGFEKVDPSSQYIADVLGTDEVSDLALIQLRNNSKINRFAEFANEADITVASQVHAIGHPYGEEWTYNVGELSSYRKNYFWGENNRFNADVIQHQAPIHPGNSGGPLLNDDKRILGINSFIKAPGINFAVSISTIKDFLKNKKNVYNPIINKRKALLSEKLDTNNDGFADGERFDGNNNGVFDVLAFDRDKDGISDLWYHDTNENGIPDLTIEFDREKGVEIWKYDENEDQLIEKICIDTDLDQVVNKCQP